MFGGGICHRRLRETTARSEPRNWRENRRCSGRACSRLRVCPLGCLHFPRSQHVTNDTHCGQSCFLLPRVKDKTSRRHLQAPGRGTGGQARWRTAGHSHPDAARVHWGTGRAPAGHGHSSRVLLRCRHQARIQVLCQDTATLLEYRDTRDTAGGTVHGGGTGTGVRSHCQVKVHGGGMSSGYRCSPRGKTPSDTRVQSPCWDTGTQGAILLGHSCLGGAAWVTLPGQSSADGERPG